jgi:hypothetical protein
MVLATWHEMERPKKGLKSLHPLSIVIEKGCSKEVQLWLGSIRFAVAPLHCRILSRDGWSTRGRRMGRDG